MPKLAARRFIAIVDDDKCVRDAVENLLNAVGCPPLAFASAEDFLICGRLDVIACALVDIELQGMSGLDLCQLMRAQQLPIPVLLVSGHGDDATHALALRAGARAFLCKPIEAEILLNCIDAVLLGG